MENMVQGDQFIPVTLVIIKLNVKLLLLEKLCYLIYLISFLLEIMIKVLLVKIDCLLELICI